MTASRSPTLNAAGDFPDVLRKGKENGSLAKDSTCSESDQTDQKVAADEYPHGIRLVLLAGASTMGIFLIALDQTIVGTAIPKITSEFHGINDVSWYGAAYFMTFGGLEAA
ncbi:major facilitator superfamily protein [Hirsutella rhossiliensis]